MITFALVFPCRTYFSSRSSFCSAKQNNVIHSANKKTVNTQYWNITYFKRSRDNSVNKLHLSGSLLLTSYANDVKKLVLVSNYILALVRVGLITWLEFGNASVTVLIKWHKCTYFPPHLFWGRLLCLMCC